MEEERVLGALRMWLRNYLMGEEGELLLQVLHLRDQCRIHGIVLHRLKWTEYGSPSLHITHSLARSWRDEDLLYQN